MGQQFLDLEGTKILANKIKEKAGYMPDYTLVNDTDKQIIKKLITITPKNVYSNGVYKFQLASRIETIGDFEVYVSSGNDKYINVSIQYEGNSDIANRLSGYLFKNTSTQTTTFELYYIVKAWDETKVYNRTLNPRNFNLVYNMTNVSALPTNATTTITPVAKAWKGNSASATKLQTARTINGVSFDGTANITIADNTKVPNTGGNIKGKILISDLNTFKDQAPGITLAIGDSDTGFKAPSDGNTEYWSNNVKQYNMKDVYHTGRKPTPNEIGASPSNHNHDDRYYTESEINSKINTINNNIGQLSNPNLLINGDFQVWQRGTNFTGSHIYTADRWLIAGDTQPKVEKTNNGVKITSTRKGTWTNFLTRLESATLKKLIGKTLTYTIKLKVPTKISQVWCLTNSPSGLIYHHEKVFSDKNYEYLTGSFVVKSTELNDNSCFELGIQGIPEANNSFEIEYAKLELGSVATPFVPRPYAEELALCQRYYEKTAPDIMFGGGKTHTAYFVEYNYNVEKRVEPTIKLGNGNSQNQLYSFLPNKLGLMGISHADSEKKKARIYIPLVNDDNIPPGTVVSFTGWLTSDAEIY